MCIRDRSKWDDMNQIEKILYYWLEVNTHAYRLLRDTDIDHVVVKFEDLFQDEGMMRILDLADLRYKKELQEDYVKVYDRFSYISPYTVPSDVEWDENLNAMSKKLGYNLINN